MKNDDNEPDEENFLQHTEVKLDIGNSCVCGNSSLNGQVCTEFDLFIANGVCDGDFPGNFTYISTSGCSVIDNYIFSNDLRECCKSLVAGPKIESKHIPVELTLTVEKETYESKLQNSKG